MKTIDQVISSIYEENYSHFDFMENMNGGDCDCILHLTMETLNYYSKEAHV